MVDATWEKFLTDNSNNKIIKLKILCLKLCNKFGFVHSQGGTIKKSDFKLTMLCLVHIFLSHLFEVEIIPLCCQENSQESMPL